MYVKIPYLTREEIEQKAALLIIDYCEKNPDKIIPPIPVESIIEKYFNLSLEVDDLKSILNMGDVLGATYIDQKRVIIDESIQNEGRFNFTCAHELGHWVLHRNCFKKKEQHHNKRKNIDDTIVCRSSAKNERIELQANYFAASLLMPVKIVEKFLCNKYGSVKEFLLRIKYISEELDTAVKYLSPIFKVSKEAMLIRLEGDLHIHELKNKVS